MKKPLAIILSILLVAAVFTACGGILGKNSGIADDVNNNQIGGCTNAGKVVTIAPYCGSIVGYVDKSMDVSGCDYVDNSVFGDKKRIYPAPAICMPITTKYLLTKQKKDSPNILGIKSYIFKA